MRRILLAALACLCAAAPAVIDGGTARAATADCAGTVEVTAPTFDRQSVAPGQSFTATAAITNCTDQPQQVSGYWRAQSVMPPGAPYTFCTGNDPFPLNAQLAPGGTYVTSMRWDIANPQCAATAIRASVVLYAPSVTRSADIPVTGAGGPRSCVASYRTLNEAPTGFVAEVTVANPTAAPVNGWSVVFTYPGDQRITASWNAVVQQDGQVVTATNASWNATIPPGGSVTYGLYGNWRRSDAPPTTLTCR
ncbi:cellulose binding domain-containing protein [Micromonospora zhanjiangensis]|uniref:Cellulose binding domain-containing protein n=1 Tax=Micromonospora zhanjiangensis TaxID=1522057 RepID=A0ABV8KNB7_9ACTN